MDIRHRWIDIAKGFLIIFIVLGHIISNNEVVFQTWIYSFHVAGFFLINGILKNRTNYVMKNESFICIIKKQKSIYCMYAVFSIIFLVRMVVQYLFGLCSFDYLIRFTYHMIMMIGEGVLWFVPTFTFAELIFWITTKSKRIKEYLALFFVSLIILQVLDISSIHQLVNPFKLVMVVWIRTMIGSSFMLIGYCMDKKKLFDRRWLLLGFVSVFSVINGNVDMNNLLFHNLLLYYLFAIGGTMLIILLSKLVEKYGKRVGATLAYFGKNSLIIMLTHAIFLVFQVANIISARIFSLNVWVWGFSLVLTMLVELIIVEIYNKIMTNLKKNSKP